MTDYVLGVDGGNTKTVALVAGVDGTILGAGRAGCADIYGAGSPEAALIEIEAAVAEACARAGIRPTELAAGAFSLAGADWPEDFDLLRGELVRRGMGRRVEVYHDSIGALRAGSPDGTGVAIVLGTATAIGARSAEGRIWHTSFWQWEGAGGNDLGVTAIRLVLRAELGIDPPTALTPLLLEHFGAASVEEMLHDLTRRGAPRRNHALLAPFVLEASERGDPAARDTVEAFGKTVADYALVAARKVGLEGAAFWLVLSGGVLRGAANTLVNAVLERIRVHNPGVQPIRSGYEPAIGALLLALETAGVRVDERIHANLRATLPPDPLFAT